MLVNNETENRIINIMSAVFEIPADEINEESSPDTIKSWDSLKHINLVVALEEEFGVQFSDNEIIDLSNYPLIVSTLKGKISV